MASACGDMLFIEDVVQWLLFKPTKTTTVMEGYGGMLILSILTSASGLHCLIFDQDLNYETLQYIIKPRRKQKSLHWLKNFSISV
jgi:hypothetical protein